MLPAQACLRRQAALVFCLAASLGVGLITESQAQTASPTLRLRGDIVSVTPTSLVVKDRSG